MPVGRVDFGRQGRADPLYASASSIEDPLCEADPRPTRDGRKLCAASRRASPFAQVADLGGLAGLLCRRARCELRAVR